MTSGTFTINGYPIGYDRYGTGPSPVLMIPGAIGTGKTDFYEQLEGDDQLDQHKFTIIAVDPPGWGRSRPPARKYDQNLYDNDVECYYELMKHLGFEKFHVIGWSDGAIAGVWMACKYPGVVTRMAVHGILCTLYPQTIYVLKSTRNVEGWPKERLDNCLRSYESKEDIQKLWDRHLKFVDYFNSYFPQDTNISKYLKVNCPILVMHGDRDPISTIEHPEYFVKHIKSARLHRFPAGNHDLHSRYDRYSTGSSPVLMIPGALGTGKTDFYEQLEGDDQLDQDKFTIIAVDPPGWGRSRPPARKYDEDVYNNDADCYYELMKMACKYPDVVIQMAIHGILGTPSPKTMSVLMSTRNVEDWPKERLDSCRRAYQSKEELQKLWDRFLKFVDYFTSYFPRDINISNYSKVTCPILVMHGDNDPISTIEHPEYFVKHIKSARLHRFPAGNHALHSSYSSSYKRLVEEFLLK
ncbi:unnamed protein product [Medioppia subpectinata]|uniref:AB hydrolase-1 domain-containing protein n=1 Tax=Medioppia subpectinata TaxID=1979941 RepID=A0A7R9Q0T5_9ACAR|nr:unnamed protein product [Medioppia subpectinata]CAG2108450.1 unnamed protein product [Medioppia subpectinata]